MFSKFTLQTRTKYQNTKIQIAQDIGLAPLGEGDHSLFGMDFVSLIYT